MSSSVAVACCLQVQLSLRKAYFEVNSQRWFWKSADTYECIYMTSSHTSQNFSCEIMKTTLIKSYTLQLVSCMLACPILTWGNHPDRYCEGKLGAQSFKNSNNENTFFFTSYQNINVLDWCTKPMLMRRPYGQNKEYKHVSQGVAKSSFFN